MHLDRTPLVLIPLMIALLAVGCTRTRTHSDPGPEVTTFVESEFNGGVTSANDVGQVSVFTKLEILGSVDPPNDFVDFYRIESTAPLSWNLSATTTPSSCQLDVGIYDSNANLIVCVPGVGQLDLPAGVHFVDVTLALNQPCLDVAYTLKIDFAPPTGTPSSAAPTPPTPLAELQMIEGSDETIVLMRSNDPHVDEAWMRGLQRQFR